MSKRNELIQETSEQELVIVRVFNAPRKLVFKAFTEAESLAQWWGPSGFTIRVVKLEVRTGGIFHYCMEANDGQDMWGKFTFREIKEPERIVFINSFSDKKGNTARAPFDGKWPLEMLCTWTFTEHQGKTTLTLRSWPIHSTEEENRIFFDGHASMHQGFGETFDQLDKFLAKIIKSNAA